MAGAEAAGTDWVAVVGACTGVIALLWNIGRALTERERLHVTFFAYRNEQHGTVTTAADVVVTNIGRLPAFVNEVGTTKHVPVTDRLWIVRSRSFRTRQRRPLERFYTRETIWIARIDRNVGRLEPGESREFTIDDDGRVTDLLAAGATAVVSSGVRRYTAKMVDARTSTAEVVAESHPKV